MKKTSPPLIEQYKQRAVELGLSQSEIARQYGVPSTRVCRWFGAEPPQSLRVLQRLAEILDAELHTELVVKKKTKRRKKNK